ncbi:hypothetical protein GHT06_018429 [Daphnia sinensis]|uniref:Uncharacterized protein n=1 Tax=Daphnia sinensis TaxID=1820382 RepID=A0AAD5L5Y9_9CRUS|nr:hypothetical protein GHT06_018429 [Daphnia sinensis]
MATSGQPTQEIRQIAKLNGKNWSSWRYGVSLLLEKNRLNRVVSKQELLPPQVRFFVCGNKCKFIDRYRTEGR